MKIWTQIALGLASGVITFGAAGQTAAQAPAGDNAGGAYPLGAESIGVANLPPPGTYLLNYTSYYTADRVNDGNGDSLVPGFGIEAYANAFRLVHVTPYKLLGATVAVQAVIPAVDLSVKAAGARDHDFGIADISISPVVLGWSINNLNLVATMDVFLPTGRFDRNRLANLGRNAWSVEPLVAMTYNSPSGWEASAKVMYDFNTTNDDTDYRSGDEFHVDFGLGKTIAGTTFGLAGYYFTQTTDDEIAGVRVGPDGNRSQVFAMGPTVKHQFGKLPVHFQWQHEFESENMPQGDKFWIKTAVRL